MAVVDQAEVTKSDGVSQDFRGGPGERQVTVLAAEDWQAACDQVGKELPWTHRRANLFIEGVPLCETTGMVICIGDVQLEVTGETDPCGRMDQAEPGLREALTPHWRGGVCCRVLQSGTIHAGQSVTSIPVTNS
ncbi:MAG: MOSC domain-containing protein [Planctomycetota bacterium]